MELGTAKCMRNFIGVERRLRMEETEVINGFIGFGKLVFKRCGGLLVVIKRK